jgi:hypothetical protein
LIAPSLDIVGGQSIQANQLLRRLASEPAVQVQFLPINPRLPPILRMTLRVKYLRTLLTSVLYLARLVSSIGRASVLHIFTPGYFSFYLAPVPALLLARLLGKPAILNYHDGRAEDHLAHSSLARRLMRLATAIVVPSDYLVDVFARFGLRATRIHNVAETQSFSYRDPAPFSSTIAALPPSTTPPARCARSRSFRTATPRRASQSRTMDRCGPRSKH